MYLYCRNAKTNNTQFNIEDRNHNFLFFPTHLFNFGIQSYSTSEEMPHRLKFHHLKF